MSSESGTSRRKRTSMLKRFSSMGASMRSRGSSAFLKFQKDFIGLQDSDAVKCHGWLFCLSELLLSFSWNTFGTTERSEEVLKMRGITPREDTLNNLFVIGWVSFASFFIGLIMDSFTGYYAMGIFNVMLHFFLSSLFLAGEVVNESAKEDLYAIILTHVYLWTYMPIKALGFTRYLYAMDQVSFGKGYLFVLHYTFIFVLFNIIGTLVFTIIFDISASPTVLSALAFSFDGAVLFLYAYLLRPQYRMGRPHHNALTIWGVLFTAFWNKRKFRGKLKRFDFLEFAENTFEKVDIARARRVFRLFLITFPTTGFLLFTNYKDVIFKEFFDNLRLTGTDVPMWIKWLLPASTLMAMVIVEYLLIPLLRACRCKVNFLRRFLLGYISMLVAVTFAAIVTPSIERFPLRSGRGVFRVYNTIRGNVSLNTFDREISDFNFTVLHQRTFRVQIPVTEQNLFGVTLTFINSEEDDVLGNTISYHQYFTAIPGELLQYIAIAPASMVRVHGRVPVKEGPPGLNHGGKPRCFVISCISGVTLTIEIVNDKTRERAQYELTPGEVSIFQVEEGHYTIGYPGSGQEVNSFMEVGGLYGIYLYLGLIDYEVVVDQIFPGNTAHGLIGLGVTVPMGFAQVLGQVSLDAFVYSSAPDGLKGVAFGFYVLCIYLAAWFIWVGFITWHYFITPDVILVYAVIGLISFICCLALLVRFKHHYTI